MDMPAFLECYMGLLGQFCEKLGFAPKATVDAVWKGTGAMVRNTGGVTNEECFWAAFSAALGPRVLSLKDEFEHFYVTDFHKARAACGPNPLAAPLVRRLRRAGLRVVLATNPLFPLSAVRSRLAWLGLNTEDFDHVTSYENSRYSKPNPAYFHEVLTNTGAKAEYSLMVGNDVDDDGAAEKAGIGLYLVTDCLVNASGAELSRWKSGSFEELDAYLNF